MNTVPSPKAEAASRRADSRASARASGPSTTRMPRPPPPAEAFTSTGHPRASTDASAAPSSAPSSRAPSSCTVGSTGTPAADTVALAASFEPMASMTSGGGPTKTSPTPTQRPGEAGVLGQKAVPGVHGVGPAGAGRVHQGVDVEIGVGRRGARQAHELVGFGHVRRVGVGLRIHRHAADAEAARAADHAPGDLAPVGDEELGDHWVTSITGSHRSRGHIRNTP